MLEQNRQKKSRLVNIIVTMFNMSSSEITGFGKCMVCLVLNLTTYFSCGGGVLKFTLEPPDPNYARNGSNAKLVWDYSVDNQAELLGIIYSVKGSNGAFTGMLVKLMDGSVADHQNIPTAYKGRVRIEGRATLVIENITPQDNTEFKCALVPNSGLDLESEVQLIVTVPPQISLSSVPSSYNEGSVVNITCTASEIPEPDVKWFRNGIMKSQGTKTVLLTFNNVNRTDDGRYKCQANNSAGDIGNYVALVVHYKPEGTTLTTSAADNTVIQGNTVTFTRHVTAAKPQVSRYRFSLNDTTIVKDSNGSQYTINNVQRSQHYGKYKCLPSNDVGDGPEASVILNVNVPTQFTALPKNLTVNETNSILLSCDASGFPEPSFTWTKNGKVLSESKQLNIQRSYRNNTGTYECTASNGIGQDKRARSFVTVQYAPVIKKVAASSDTSWIGQTVTLTCKLDGFPIPTITWHKPDGVKPGFPTIGQLDIEATSLTVKWTAPADDGRSPITAYRVVILKGGTEIKNVNITDPLITSLSVGDLERNTEYTVKVFARNAVFEGSAGEKEVKTKYEGVPSAATIDDLPNEVTDDRITLRWSEPQNNGRVITQYTVYQRIVTDDETGEWIVLKTIPDVSVRELNVELESGKVYEFVITATNELGESLKEDEKIMRVKALVKEVPPTITLKSKGKVTIVEGNVLYLFCEAEGNPKPLVTWRKNGRVLQSNISKTELIIHDASENDAGTYECEVSNSVGALTYTVEVAVKGSSCNELVLHIVYIIVILVLLIIILILIIVLRRLRSGAAIPKRNRENICAECGGDLVVLNTMASETKKQSSSIVPSGDSTTYAALSSGDYMPLHRSVRSWELKREQVKILKVIGKGAFSQVAKATAWNISSDEEYSTVAVKMLKANAPDSDRNDLLSELEVMKKLKPHPHVIKLMGCVTESDPLLVLIEYVPYGDLLGYLRKSRGLNDTYFKDPDVKPQTNLTAELLMRFAWQIADGMFYLSSRKIIHRDLAARNVLVGEGEKCKVTDFGMARNVQQDDIYTKRSRGRLPVKWTAYEALLFGTYTTQSDVWSYGVLLYEILTVGGSPYPGIQARQIARKLQEGFRMPKPKHVDNKLYQIMLKCWEENPGDRPTFTKLKDMMKEIERNHRTYVNLKQYDNSFYANVEDLTAE